MRCRIPAELGVGVPLSVVGVGRSQASTDMSSIISAANCRCRLGDRVLLMIPPLDPLPSEGAYERYRQQVRPPDSRPNRVSHAPWWRTSLAWHLEYTAAPYMMKREPCSLRCLWPRRCVVDRGLPWSTTACRGRLCSVAV